MECIWCKAFYESKDIKKWEKRKCLICWKELVKNMDINDFFWWIFKNK